MRRQDYESNVWQIQRKNEAQPFTYRFPQMPFYFRFQRAVNRGLILLEWFCMSLLLGGLCVCVVQAFVFGMQTPAAFLNAMFASPFLFYIFRLLRYFHGFTWKCPCCRNQFPYYSPVFRGLDTLKGRECMNAMEFLRIRYCRSKCCSLILPAICPDCKKRFYDYNKKI